LAAREKSGKSTFATAGAAAVILGRPFLAETVTTARCVLWVALDEHVHDLARRFVSFGVSGLPATEVVHVIEMANIDQIAAEASILKPDLIVIDTLGMLAELHGINDASSSTAWTPLMSRLSSLARSTNAAIVVLHHATKAGGNYRDSSAIGAGVDVIIEVDQGGADDPKLRKFRIKGRWYVPEFSARFDGSTYLLTGELSVREKIVQHIQASPGATRDAVCQAIGSRRADVLSEIDALVKSGAIVDRRTGKRSSLWAGSSLPAISEVPDSESMGTNRER
jgi:predicted ATP-dependent serine protease